VQTSAKFLGICVWDDSVQQAKDAQNKIGLMALEMTEITDQIVLSGEKSMT
jgi:hypothetical protein